MPKIEVNGEIFIAAWPKESDKIIIAVAKKYKRGKIIRWQIAEAERALNGVLDVPLKKIICRYKFLKNKARIYAKRRRKKANGQTSVNGYHLFKRRLSLQHDAGYKSKKTNWQLKDEILLLHLTEKYTINKRIKWKLLINDKRAKKLPKNVRLLSSTYNRLINQDAHRKSALEWKKKNRQRFNETVQRRLKEKRQLIRQFLWDKIGVK
jgi:hypothetical protein